MAYQDRFTNWESTGLKIIPVLSRADDSWKGERGYVQDAFLKAQNIANHFSTGAVLCGQKQMSEACLSSLFFFYFCTFLLLCVLQVTNIMFGSSGQRAETLRI
jgi:hypothetical protein